MELDPLSSHASSSRVKKRRSKNDGKTDGEKKSRTSLSSSSPLDFPFLLPSVPPTKEELLATEKLLEASVRETLEGVVNEMKVTQFFDAKAIYEDGDLTDESTIRSMIEPSEVGSVISLVEERLGSLGSAFNNYKKQQARSFDVRLQEESLAQAMAGSRRTLGFVSAPLPPFFEHAREVSCQRPALNQLAVSLEQMVAIGIPPKEAIGALERSLKSMGEKTVPIDGPLRKQLLEMQVEQPALLVGIAEGIANALSEGGVLHYYGTRSMASTEEKDLFASGRGLANKFKSELEKLPGAAPLDKEKAFGGPHSKKLFKAKLSAINLVESMSHFFALKGARLLIKMLDEKGAAHPLAVFFTEVTKVDSSLSGVHVKLATAISASEAPAVIKILGESEYRAGVGIHIDVLKDIGCYESFYPLEAIRYTGYPREASSRESKNIPRLQRCFIRKDKSTSAKTGEVYKVIHLGRYQNDAGKWMQYKCCWGRLVEAACTAPGKGTGDTGVVMRVKGTHFRNMLLFERAKAGEISELLERLGIKEVKEASNSKEQRSTSSSLPSNPQQSRTSLSSSSPLDFPFLLPSVPPTKEELLATEKLLEASVRETLEGVVNELKVIQFFDAKAIYDDADLNGESTIRSMIEPSEVGSMISLVEERLGSLGSAFNNYKKQQARSFDVRLQEESLAQAMAGSRRTLGFVSAPLPPFFEHAREVSCQRPALNQLAVSLEQMVAIGIPPKEAIGALERSLKSMGEKTVPIDGPLRKQLLEMQVEQPALLVGIAESIVEALSEGGVLHHVGTRSSASTEEKNLFRSGLVLASRFKSELEKLHGAKQIDKVKTFIGQERVDEMMINLEEARIVVRNAKNKSSSDNVASILRWFDSRVTFYTVNDFTAEKKPNGLDSRAYIAMQSIFRSNDYNLADTKKYFLRKLTEKAAVDPNDHVLKAHLEPSNSLASKSIIDIKDIIRVVKGAIDISSHAAVSKVFHWYDNDINCLLIQNFFRTKRTRTLKWVVSKAFLNIYNACDRDMAKTEAYINAKSIEENPVGGPELDKHNAPDDATLAEKLTYEEATRMIDVEKDSSRNDVVKVLKRFNDSVNCDSIKAFFRYRVQRGGAYIALQSIFRAVDYNLDAAIAYLAAKSKEKEVPDASDTVLQKHLAAGVGHSLAAKLTAINLVESMSHFFALKGARLLIKMLDEKGAAHPLAVFFTEVTKVDSSLSGVHVKLATAISASEAPAVIKILGESEYRAGVGIHIDVLKDIGCYESFYPLEAIRYTGYPREASNRASKNIPRLQRCFFEKKKYTSASNGEVYKVIHLGRYQNDAGKWKQYKCCWGRLVEAACTAPGKGTGDASIVMRIKGIHFRNMLRFERAKAREISELMARL